MNNDTKNLNPYQEYERRKRALWDKALTPVEYEAEIKKIAEELDI